MTGCWTELCCTVMVSPASALVVECVSDWPVYCCVCDSEVETEAGSCRWYEADVVVVVYVSLWNSSETQVVIVSSVIYVSM